MAQAKINADGYLEPTTFAELEEDFPVLLRRSCKGERVRIRLNNFDRIPRLRGKFHIEIRGDIFPKEIEIEENSDVFLDLKGGGTTLVKGWGTKVRVFACKNAGVDVCMYNPGSFLDLGVYDQATARVALHSQSFGMINAEDDGRVNLTLHDSATAECVWVRSRSRLQAELRDHSRARLTVSGASTRAEVTLREEAILTATAHYRSFLSLRASEETHSKVCLYDQTRAELALGPDTTSSVRTTGQSTLVVLPEGAEAPATEVLGGEGGVHVLRDPTTVFLRKGGHSQVMVAKRAAS